MKAILEFNLPEEESEFHLAQSGSKYLFALNDIRDFLRSETKYRPLTKEQSDYLEKIQTKFYEILNTYDVAGDC